MSAAVAENERTPAFALDELVPLARRALAEREAMPVRSGLDGAVGDALFACAFAAVDRDIDVQAWLARAIRAVNANRPGPSLHLGVAGLGFVLASYGEGVDDRLERIDALLASSLASLPPASMQSGVAGIGIYAALRSHAASGRALQDAVLAALAASAEKSDGGLVWPTPFSYARARGVPASEGPVLDYGMVHGVAGTLTALTALAAAGRERAADLARAGLVALFARARSGDNCFGRIDFGPPGAQASHEFAGERWCVGDIGVFDAAARTARCVGDAAAEARAFDWLRRRAREHASGAHAGEAGRYDLCCGAGVIAQLYWRLHRQTGEAVFAEANRRVAQDCAAGLATMTKTSFAYGRLGTLLALTSTLVDAEPAWDAVIGLSAPTTPEMRRSASRSSAPSLATLLQPGTVEQLVAEHWDRRALFVAGTADKIAGLALDRETFLRLAESAPRGLKAQSFDADGAHAERAIDGQSARLRYDAGQTLCLAGLERLHPPLAALAGGVRRALRLSASIQINGYLSPAGGGFGLHFDDHDALVVQLEGDKRWSYAERPLLPGAPANVVAGGPAERALRARWPWFTAPFPDDASLVEQRLRPGDVLYLPTGTPHRTQAGDHSLALTIVCGAQPFARLFLELVDAALQPSADGRARLPPWPDDDAEAARRFVAERLALARAAVANLDEAMLLAAWRRAVAE